MQFDIVIGNPPYQENDGGGTGTSAKPLYNEFVLMADRVANKHIMIIPSRWFSGGKGLDSFREWMINNKHIVEIHEYSDFRAVFKNVKITGGVCYYFIDNAYNGSCKVFNHTDNGADALDRDLKTFDIVVRSNTIHSILDRCTDLENSFSFMVSERRPYNLGSDFFLTYDKYISDTPFEGSIKVCGSITNKRVIKYIRKSDININRQGTDKFRIFLSKTIDSDIFISILKPLIAEPFSICTESYLEIGPFQSLAEAKNAVSYIKTKFFHAIFLNCASSQNITKKSFRYIPLQDFSHHWSDEMLYDKYNLSGVEKEYIETLVRNIVYS